MLRFLAGRLVGSLIVLLVMSLVIYLLIGLMPGDPVDLMFQADPDLTAEDIANLKAIYGLDQPLMNRYAAWLGNALQGDFGFSRTYRQPVLDVLAPRLGNTLWLMGISFFLSLAIAIPLGVVAAVKPHGPVDLGVNIVALAGYSMPVFWLALLLIYVFAVELAWLPAGGSGADAQGLAAKAQFLVLPVAALTLTGLGALTRFTRGEMIDALRQDYVRTARAKGLSRRRVILHHAFRNAMIPVVTIAALGFGSLISGALVVETMFGYLGMGKLMFDSIMANDYNVALVGLLIATLLTLIGNLAADLAYALLDPRIRYDKAAS
jgi:peptide/nickel transport system permease protein